MGRRGVATEDVRDLYLEERDPAVEYGRMAKNWRANVVRISVHPSTWKYHKDETLALLEEHVQAATSAGLFVIVDYHVIGFPDGYYQPVPPEWGFQPRAHAHYRGTAKTFGNKFRSRFLEGRELHSTAWC